MEVDSLRREVTNLKAEKANLQVKSKLFENFAAMAHSCCRLPSTAEWASLKKTLQETLDFSIAFELFCRRVECLPYTSDIMMMVQIKMVKVIGPRMHPINPATPFGLARLRVQPWDGIRLGTTVLESAWLK